MKIAFPAVLALLATTVSNERALSQTLNSPAISRSLTVDGRVLPKSKLPQEMKGMNMSDAMMKNRNLSTDCGASQVKSKRYSE